ncbi:Collagen Alpha-5(Vi) Chain [Manis pentadactyla]|nr:Collagen Alpha-5(Vi) Chain [Manis pentadactyla]
MRGRNTDPEKEGETGVKKSGDEYREIESSGEARRKRETWQRKGQSQSGEATRKGRGGLRGRGAHRRRERCQAPGREAHVGGTCGATETRAVFPGPARNAVARPAPAPSPARHPCRGHGARGDPDSEKPPRQAPRPGAAERETGKCQGSAKPKCENSGGGVETGERAAGDPPQPRPGFRAAGSHGASRSTSPQLQQVPVERAALSHTGLGPQALFHKVLRNSKLPKGKELKGKKTKKQRVCVKWNDQHRDKGE